jgi:hypothetical protein
MSRQDTSSVEHERLLCLVDTQRQHINELRVQLHETLVSCFKRISGDCLGYRACC